MLEYRIGIIGLGYVGFPLATAFGRVRDTVGFDVDKKRISELQCGIDVTGEVSSEEIKLAEKLTLTSNPENLKGVDIFVITVPTPINGDKSPDLSHLKSASTLVGRFLSEGCIVVYESTVFPGCTEEVCVPILEGVSSLKFNRDFFCGYSPERINPGDKTHTLQSVTKIVAGSVDLVSKVLEGLYAEIIPAGVYVAQSIQVAEAAKVIENTQRDLNIALINELSVLFNKMSIDTRAVLDAAATKWNFHSYKPGLVGGHCIGVDPYYLSYRAKQFGCNSKIIDAARSVNDGMMSYVVGNLIKCLGIKNIDVKGAFLLVLGCSFKKNCPDIRNSQVLALVQTCISLGINVRIYDPLVPKSSMPPEFWDLVLENMPVKRMFDAIIIAVDHDYFRQLEPKDFLNVAKNPRVIFDFHQVLDEKISDFCF